MVDVSDQPFPGCSIVDPKGDEHPSLFNQN
jgi:hypothetical protein